MSARAGDLIPLLPKTTLVAVGVSDVGGLADAWESTPLGAAMKDPGLSNVLKPVDQQIKKAPQLFQENWGFPLEKVKDLTSGGAAVFLTKYEWTTEEVYEFDACFVAEIKAEDHERVRGVVEKMLEKTPVDARRSRYTFKGETVYVTQFIREVEMGVPRLDPRTGKTDVPTPAPGSALALVEEVPIVIQYALTDTYVIVCEGRNEPIRDIIAALKDPAERLGQTPGYRRVAESPLGKGTVTGWLAAGRAWSIFADHIKQVNPDTDLSSLGLQDLGGLLVRVGLTPEAIAADLALETPKSPRGIPAMILMPGRDNPLKTASLCPATVSSYSSVLYDGQRLWTGLRAILIQFLPQVWGFVNMQISQYNQMFGIDLERGVIGTMGGELAVYRREPPSLQNRFDTAGRFGSMTLLLGLRDGKTFRQNHERMFQVLTGEPYQLPIQKTTYLDYDIWRFRQDPSLEMPTVPAWTLTDGFLAVSSDSEELPGFLRAWSGKAEVTLADDPDFKAALGQFPQGNRMSFSYTPAKSIPDVVQPTLYMVAGQLGQDYEWAAKAMEPGVREALIRHIGSLSESTYVEPQVVRLQSRLRAAKP